jgi:hypothetical protein
VLRRLRRDMRVLLEPKDPDRATAVIARRADRVKPMPGLEPGTLLHEEGPGVKRTMTVLYGLRARGLDG